MRRLLVDFNNQNGLEMIVSANPPIRIDELQQFELRMLTENEMNRLLPFTYSTIDDEVQFFYRIQSLKMLEQLIKRHHYTQREFYSAISSLLDALMSCYTYMLNPEACLLDSRYIFVHPPSGQLRLAYMPLKTRESLQSQLLKLIIKWSATVKDLDVYTHQQLLNEIAQDDFQLKVLQQKVHQMLLQHTTTDESIMIQANEALLHSKDETIINPQMKISMQKRLENQHQIQEGNPGDINIKEKGLQNSLVFGDLEEQGEVNQAWHETKQAKGRRLELKDGLILTIMLLGIVAAWMKIYIPSPTALSLWLCIGISLICVAICLLFVNKKLKLISSQEDDEEQDWFAIDMNTSPGTSKLEATVARHHQAGDTSRIQHVQPSMDTVVLDSDTHTVHLTQTRPISLLRQFQNTEVTVEITDDCFVIGSSKEGVHFYEEAAGVSRLHLQIEKTAQGIKLKDMGSRNGSYMNGKLMTPYKLYSLTSYDYVQLVNDRGPKYRLVE